MVLARATPERSHPRLTHSLRLRQGFNALETIGDEPISFAGETVDFMRIGENPFLFSLDGFNALTDIAGFLLIDQNFELVNLTGFSSLERVGSTTRSVGLQLTLNPRLRTLSAFPALETVDGRLIFSFNGLLDISGFNSLTTVTFGIQIDQNLILDISGFGALVSESGSISITDNDRLETITGFAALEFVTALTINDNDALSSIPGVRAPRRRTGPARRSCAAVRL